MYGAILGDMIGAPYEFDRGNKSKSFILFGEDVHFTDDSVMTVAVAEALLDNVGKADNEVKSAIIKSMQKWGRKYPHAGYGGMFYRWLREKNPWPYGSFGNGSAMRVSSVGWLYETIEETRHYAKLTAEVTHNHPEGIKGAEATATAIYMARCGSSKDEIRDYIIKEFGYNLSRTCDEIRPTYYHVETCQETVPEAIIAFLEGNNFEEVIRTAVSLGGDCDTLTCIAGGIAEAFYGVPNDMILECRKRLPDDMLAVLNIFDENRRTQESSIDDCFLAGNDLIEKAISAYHSETSKENLCGVLEAIRQRIHEDGHFMIPVIASEDGTEFSFRTVQTNDGSVWNVAFTTQKEYKKGEPSQILSHFIDATLKASMDKGSTGFILNPWGESFTLTPNLIDMIFKADNGVEYSIPDVQITPELLEGGVFLKRAIGICNRNRTGLNVIKLMKILRDSYVWIPCNAILSDTDYNNWSKLVEDAKEKGALDSITGTTLRNQDDIRMVPDILQNGECFYFPIFSAADEMGEYGKNFSKIEKHFLEAVNLARNNKKDISGIVINAFTEPYIVPKEMLEMITEMPSSIENVEENENG